jgi:phosphatidylinositol kinase/protein kinase (PI-3  family)
MYEVDSQEHYRICYLQILITMELTFHVHKNKMPCLAEKLLAAHTLCSYSSFKLNFIFINSDTNIH